MIIENPNFTQIRFTVLKNNVALIAQIFHCINMKKFINLLFGLFIIAAIIVPLSAHSQYYSSGQDPASTKWNHINSSNFQVIYPRGYDSVAQYVLNVMEYGRVLSMKTRHVETKKISIILHNQTVISNAEVAWAPSRMEFYSVTPQSTYSQPWYEQLAIHEYTHVLQLSSMKQGFTKFLYTIFGEQITAGLFGLYVPYWFIEGDAVVAETALSKSGRGRDPNFEAELRAQLLEIGAYTIEKAALGSYKDFTTDRYHLGYYIVGQGRAVYGKNMWNKPMEKIGKYPLSVAPFSNGILYETGVRKKLFYENTLSELSQEWTKQLVLKKPNYYTPISQSKSYCNYTNTNFLSDNQIFTLKKDYHDIGRFIIMDTDGKEEKSFTPGYYFSDYISTSGDWVCWAEYQYDPRWNYRTFARILLLNTKTGKKKTLLKNTRYFSPNISPSGKKIAVVEVDEFSKHFLVILDAQDGHIIQKFSAPDNEFIAHPAWSPKDDMIVAEVLNGEGKGLAIFKLDSGHVQNILAFTNTHMQYPTFWENYILFEAAYSGVMDVYALDLKTKSLYQTTNSAFSASDYCISPNGQKQIFSSYSSNGKQLVIKDWDPKTWTPFSEVENQSYPLADILSKQVDTTLNPNFIPTNKYEVKKYSKLGNAVNIHSWNFLHIDGNNGSINPGISVLSQNHLSTLSARIGADYSYNTNAMRYYASVDYLGWYPAISLQADYGRRYTAEITDVDTTFHYWNETNMTASIYVPLSYTSGPWSYNIQPQLSFNLMHLDPDPGISFDYNDIQTLNYGLYISGVHKSPYQNIYPKWGYALSLAYRTTPFSLDDNIELGDMFSLGLSTYLPGFFQHDGFRLMATYQDKIGEAGFYSDMAGPARGYTGIIYDDMTTLRADYSVPILYPDYNLGSLVYFKRITMSVFYDHSIIPNAHANASYPENNFWSTGVDLTTDVHFLRSKFPFYLGLRTTYIDGYVKNPEAIVYQLLWGIGI